MTQTFIRNPPPELWEMCSGVRGPEISLVASLRCVSKFLGENRNHLDTREVFGDISAQGISYISLASSFR